MLSRHLLRITFGALLCLAIATSGLGQPTTTPTPIPVPSTTSAVVYVVTSLVVLVTVVYLVFHKHKDDTHNQPSFVGCTAATENGTVLTDDKDGQDYVILPGSINLKPGERVQVLGKKDEDEKGRLALQVGKLVRDYGPCNPNASPSAPAEPR